MFMRTALVMQRRRVSMAMVAVMAGAIGLTGAGPAAAATVTVDCTANPAALQPAINAAAPGDTLRVIGTCIGPFTINQDLNVIGRRNAVLDGNNAGNSPAVLVNNSVVALDRLTVTNGNAAPAGGIFNNGGTITMNRSSVTDNTSGFAGGGIMNTGVMTLTATTVSGNFAPNIGGGIFNQGGANLTLIRSTVTDNTAGSNGGGIYDNGGTVSLVRSTVTGNLPNDCVNVPGC